MLLPVIIHSVTNMIPVHLTVRTAWAFRLRSTRQVCSRLCTCHHLTAIKHSKVCIPKPGLFPAFAFLQFIGYSHAQSS